MVLGNSIYERSAIGPPGFSIQHTRQQLAMAHRIAYATVTIPVDMDADTLLDVAQERSAFSAVWTARADVLSLDNLSQYGLLFR